jgi:hypothetical protein
LEKKGGVKMAILKIRDENGKVIEIAALPGVKGEKGEQGPAGTDGADGYTPQRGIDYWTDEDVSAIKSYVDEAILGGAW